MAKLTYFMCFTTLLLGQRFKNELFGLQNSDHENVGNQISNLGIRSPIFFGPKSFKFAVFGCQKMGLQMPKSKKDDHFLPPTIPKYGGIDSCFTRISFSGEFWANFENRVF